MRIRVGDVHLYFDTAGMGLVPDGPEMRDRPVIICLHGGPGFDHSTLKHYLTPLAEDAQLVFLDHRGQGRSDESTPERWNFDTWIEDLRGFCEALEIERPVLFGQSFGGMVALGTAIRHPELPGKLIVSSSAAKIRLDRALPMFEQLGGKEARDLAKRLFEDPNQENFDAYVATCLPLYNTTKADPDILARVRLKPEVGFHFFRGEGLTFDWLGDLGRVQCPTLILAGEADPITPVADHEDLAAGIRGSRLEVFADAGHGVFRDKPVEALELVREFVLGESGADPG